MKKIILLCLAAFLIIGTLATNLTQTLKIIPQINLSNFGAWFVGFLLDYLTNPAGLLGLVLLIIGLRVKKKSST